MTTSSNPIRLSLVMPVYNVAAYLPACLDSLLAQTVVPDEIIAVDDGSTDASPNILDEYARRLPQLRVIRQTNSGQSVARNTGLDQVRGEWIVFIDSDDILAPTMFARMLEMAEADNLDIALCNAWTHYEGRKPDRLIFPDAADTEVITGKEWLRQRLKANDMMHAVWMHLYRRDFIERHGFRFVPGVVYEDVVWTTQVLLAAGRVRFDSTPLYHYRFSRRYYSGATLASGADLIRRLEHVIASSVHNVHALVAIAAAETDDAELQRLLRWQLVDGGFSVFHKIERLPDRGLRRQHARELRRTGFFGLLWKHAVEAGQKRRIVHRYLKSWLP